MKILKSAQFLLFSATLAAGLSSSAIVSAESFGDNQGFNQGQVKIISRQIDRNLERVTPRSEGSRAVFNNNFHTKAQSKSNRKFSGPMFGDNDCTRRTCGGAMFGPQTCKRIKLPCEDCGEQPKPVKPRPHIKNYVTLEEDIFEGIHHRCGDFAPLQLEWVDFRIKKGRGQGYSRKLGDYRFRIFGCRRDQRHAILNEGRIIQKDMEFIRIFEDKVSDCYNIVKIPNDICLDTTNKPLPEYVLTAEITDYFMNLCDEYDWNEAQKENLRTGSAQMTITWRLMDLSKSNVLWKGESEGYSEVKDGEYNAEMILVERAFADAVDNLRQLPGFENQLAVRQTPEDLAAQKQALIAMERLNDPVKCQYQPEIKQAQTLCPVADNRFAVEENGGSASDGQMCTAQTQPELLSLCPPENPNCKGTIEELSGSSTSGRIAEDNQTLVIDTVAATPVEENGETIDMGGSIELSNNLSDREAEIADAAAKAKIRTVQFDENGGTIDLGGGATDEGTPPDFCPLDEDGNPQCGADPSQLPSDHPNYCEPSALGFLHEEDRSCSPSPVAFLHEEDRTCEPSIFDKMFGTTPSCALNTEQTIDISDFIEESGGIEDNGLFVEEEGGFIDLGGAVSTDGQAWTTIEASPEETQDIIDRNRLCVINRGPYDKLTPENIYKVRASIVGVTNANGLKGAGLLISDQFVLTSADLIVKDNNRYQLRTINGVELSGRAVRINIKKNTALILLDEKTRFTPLSLNLELPEIGTNGFMALGLLEDHDGGEGYLDNNGKVSGYRYSDDKGAEIIVDTFVQTVTIGGALIDNHGTINGMSHAGKKTEDGPDLFIPITTAINSVGLEICGQENKAPKVPMAVIKPVSTAIDSFTGSKEPKPMGTKGRK